MEGPMIYNGKEIYFKELLLKPPPGPIYKKSPKTKVSQKNNSKNTSKILPLKEQHDLKNNKVPVRAGTPRQGDLFKAMCPKKHKSKTPSLKEQSE